MPWLCCVLLKVKQMHVADGLFNIDSLFLLINLRGPMMREMSCFAESSLLQISATSVATGRKLQEMSSFQFRLQIGFTH